MCAATFTQPIRLLASVALLFCSASALQAHPPSHGQSLQGVHALDIYENNGVLHQLKAEYHEGKPAPLLLYIKSEDGGETWTAPIQVDKGLPHAHAARRGMDPQIAAFGEKIIAVWMSPGTDQFGGGPMTTSISEDGGKTWKQGPNPADDNSTEGHGFIDIISDPKGSFHLTWLDNRDGLRGLRYTQSQDYGKTWAANSTPDKETCECCWNTMAVAPDGKVAILYRDKAPRDMSVVLAAEKENQWQTPIKIGNFNWEFNGCPHVGGGIAFTETDADPIMHTAVWTGQSGQSGVYYFASTDLGKTWTEAVRFGAKTSTHPDIAINGNDILVVWSESAEDHSSTYAARSKDGGKTWSEKQQLSAKGTNASHPRVVHTQIGFRIFWTAEKEGSPSTVESALEK